MKISEAVALRIKQLLNQRNLTQYKFEHDIAMPHNTMKTLMGKRNKSVNLRTIMQISKGLNMSLAEFFNDPVFESEDLDVYD